MSDWQVGDLALCVKASASGSVSPGAVHTVSRVFSADTWVLELNEPYVGCGLVFSDIAGSPGTYGFRATLFRRIPPLADITGFEEPRRIPVKEQTHV